MIECRYKMKRHICYLGNAAAIHVQRWVNYLVEHGWEVDLITWHPPSKYHMIHSDVIVHRIHFPPHYIARYGALLEITKLIRKIRPDVIHACNVGTFGILAGHYNHLTGFNNIVFTPFGSDILIDPKGFKKWLIKYALKRAEFITCDAQHMREALINLGADPKKIIFICFGTDIHKFNPKLKSKKIKEELMLNTSQIVISVRNLEPIYDIESLIKAVPIVLKEVPNTKFLIAGRGSQETMLRDLAKSLGVSDSILFVGFLPNDKLPEYLASADIYVSTSLSDSGLSSSTAEAMACGIPVVITDFGDNYKWVKNDVNGFLVPLKNPDALAEKIIYLLKNPEVCRVFGEKNRMIIEEKNNFDEEMEKIEDLYIDLIQRC